MINLYYTAPSGSLLSNIVVYSDINMSTPQFYYDVNLEASSSKYLISGSSNYLDYTRFYIKSGSITYASFPIEGTNIFYQSYAPTASSVTASSPLSSLTPVYIYFNVNSSTTSSLNMFEISGSISSSYLSSQLATYFLSGSTQVIKLSGSGQFYSTELSIINSSFNQLEYYTSSFKDNIYAVFSPPNYTNTYIISASVINYPYLKLTYDSVSNIPVSPTNSIANWNTYLNISASSVSSSGNNIYLIGGTLAAQPTTFSVTTTHLTDFYSFGLTNLSNLTLVGSGVLSSLPYAENSNLTYLNVGTYNTISGSILNFSSSRTLQYFDASNNKISGSIQNLMSVLPTQSIQTIIVRDNNFTGSIPNLSSSLFLKYFDCSQNKLSGSILPQTEQFSLQTLICNNNHLTGSIPDLSNCYSLRYFDCGYNNFTGSIPELSSSYNLQYFECGYNELTGSIPTLSKNNYITYFSCATNKLSGSIGQISPSSSYSSSLQTFDCRENYLQGSIPALYGTQLTTFYCQDNQLSTYVSASYPTTIIPSSLINFYASNNLLTQEAVDSILRDLYYGGGVNGLVALDGTGNSAPSVSGQDYADELVKRGWVVSTN